MRCSRFALSMLLALGAPVQAAILCVSDGAQLQAAIQTADGNNEADEIRLRQGVYQSSSPSGFVLYIVDGSEVLLTGGWSGPNATCSQIDNDARLTVIDGQLTRPGMRVQIGAGNPDFSAINLSFVDGRPPPGSGFFSGAGLEIDTAAGNASDVVVERCIFEGNHASSGSGLAMSAAGNLFVRDTLFVDNSSTGSAAAASIFTTSATFINNTVTANHGDGLFSRGALEFYGDGDYGLHNNIVHGNTTPVGDADLKLVSPALLGANLIGTIEGEPQAGSVTPIDADPRFAGAGDHRLRADSPARDAGAVAPGGGGAFDVIGRPRVQGAAVDLGAFEFDAVFRDGFEEVIE